MFRIGEFAQIAQVSGRQLRYYDELGLLRPVRIDPQTGYRYYSVRQLPRLNSILALKELGLTLDQIGPLLEDRISPAELRGMLIMKQAQVEQSLREEEARLRHIQSRIDQIDHQGALKDYDVVVKSVEAAPFLSLRSRCDGMDEAIKLVAAVAEGGVRHIRPALRGKLIVVLRNDLEDAALDLEIGFSLARATNMNVQIAGDRMLSAGELAAADNMATLVRSGRGYESHKSFGAIGEWIEANGYEIVGPCREVFLEPIVGPPNMEDVLIEIQFPIRLAA